MLPNPLAQTDSPPVDAAARPQLKLAARTTQDLRDLVRTATSAVITDEVYRSHGQWRHTLEAVKETLADLERTCESAIEAHEVDVAGVIETLVGSATAEVDAAAQRTRAQAQIEMAELAAEMAELQTVVDRLQGELHVERDRVASTNEQLDIEVAARVQAESELEGARRMCQQVVSAAESQAQGLRAESDGHKAELSLVRQQLDTARAERSKLMATFQSVQRALSLTQSMDMTFEAENTGRDRVAEAESRPQEVQGENSSDTAPEQAGLTSSPVADAQVALIEADPEAADVKQVLEQVEVMYCIDLNSSRPPLEVVDSLSGHLRYARDVSVARSSLGERDAHALFEQQLAVLLELKAGTTFGRHLSIAAHASRRLVTSARGESGTAQQTVA